MHLLIVDDDHDAADTLAELLAPLVAPAHIARAYDGIEALNAVAAADSSLDAVITDIEMPGMDGLTAAQRMRHALGDKTPVLIAMTGHIGIFDHPSVKLTFDHVLRKPLRLDALVTLLLALRGPPVS